ncbi:MAG: response regulator [Planctomycetes bacterium]|nr:response regulator [Planctomycetota bacterium]
MHLSFLVVDDDESMRSLVSRYIGKLWPGSSITSFGDPAHAIALLNDGASFDAVVTDFNMPGHNGLDVLTAMRRHSTGCFGLLITGNASDMLFREAKRIGVSILEKPFGFETFGKALQLPGVERPL